jgi:dipicolinate synthase subunit A
LSPRLSDLGKVILLPIPTSRDGVTLSTGESFESVVGDAESGAVVAGYSIPALLRRAFEESGCRVVDSALDEEFLVANGELTADATLGILLTTEKRAPRDLRVGVVGYGRIGKRLTRVLLYLGADVRVYTSRTNTRLELCEFGVASRMSLSDADLSGLDVLINTAPAKIFDTSSESFPSGIRIIDLAGGNNFPDYPSVEKYPSLPAVSLPVSAGKIWAESIERACADLKR